MCYNERVKVNIASTGTGWNDEADAEGILNRTDDGVITLEYPLGGDNCTLTVKDGVVYQSRKGEQCVDISFIQGETTQCRIANGGFSGMYEIFTEKINCVSGKGGFKLSLEYLSGSDRERIKLTLTAIKNLRGKK